MDHKGPEHHYNDLENQDPTATFFQQGEIQPETVETKDGERPFRGTPNGVRSEMTERSTPLDGNAEDRGGNPLRTDKGILAKSIIEEAEEEAKQKTSPTDPEGLGEVHPVKDNTWKPGDLTTRPARDEILGSAKEFKNDDDIWDQVVNDFESAENHGVDEDSTGKVAAASWLKNDGFDSNVPTEHLGWDIVDVVEPHREVLEAQNKYSMPIPNGITDNLHNALVKLNAWVENPEEEGKLRPYKEYWSVIRPKFDKEGSMQIGVETPHDADVINHIARTDDTSPLNKNELMDKQAASAAARMAPALLSRIGVGAAEGGGVGGAMGSALNFGKNMALYNGVSNMVGDASNAVGGFLGTGGDPSSSQMVQTPGDFGVTANYYRTSDTEGMANGIAKGLKATDVVENVAKFVVDKLPIPDSLKGPITKLIIILNFEAWPELAREEATQAAAHMLEGKCPLCSSYLAGAGKPGQIGISTGFASMTCPLCQGQGTRDAFISTTSNLGEDGIETLKGKLAPVADDLKSKLSGGEEEGEEGVQTEGPEIGAEPQGQQGTQPQQPETQQGVGTIQQMPDGSLVDTSTGQKLDPNLYSYDSRTKEWYRDPNKGFNLYQKGYVGLKTLQNALNNPNEAVQTQGVTQPVRGPESFGVVRSKVATYGEDYQSPSSITRRIEDPENIDPNQRPDGSNDHWNLDMKDVNSDGQSRRTPEGEDKPNTIVSKEDKNKNLNNLEDLYSPAIERFLMMLPLVHHFFNSEDAGINDEFMKSLHEDLDSEFPDYLINGIPNEHERILFILDPENQNKDKSKKESNTSFGPEAITDTPLTNPAGRCACGGVKDASSPFCPQCAPDATSGEAKNWPYGSANSLVQDNRPTPQQELMEQQMRQQKQMQQQLQQSQIIQQMQNKKFTSNEQGPHTDEQQAAVAEFLIEKGREEEIPNMIENSYEYADELAEVQNKQPMLDEDVKDQPGPAQEQPMPNQGMPPGIPPMGAPSPADLGAPGPAAGPAPGVMASMLTAAFKHGADNVAGKCPKCDSHTTKMVQQDGKSKCHTCKHQWSDETFEKADGDSSNSSTTAAYRRALEEIEKSQHLDSFNEPEEELEIDDSTHEWVDENGEPLQEGKEYEIYAHDYDIPDVGRVVEIKPDAIVYEIESDGGLRTTIEIDRQEADQNGYRFVESGVGSSSENRPGIEENMDSKPVPVPGESTDLSTPHVMTGSTKISFDNYDEAVIEIATEWLLSLDGPYLFNEFESLSQEEYEDEVLRMHPDEILRAIDAHYDGGIDQLARDAGVANEDDNPEEGLNAFGKTAGRHYTPMEQRELIDEYGEARNADKLDLENTHYAQADDDYFLFGC